MTTTPQAALLREAAQNALITLDGIASANPRDKADFETPDEWIAWAKSRARFAADALRAPVAQEVYAERILRQMLHESDQTQSMQVEPALTEEEIWFIASDGMRSADGGIYQSSGIEFARAVEQAILAKLQATQAEPPKDVSMPQYWSVDVFSDGTKIVSIGNDWLSGERQLDEIDERTIIGAAQHLLSFVGYGLPPTSFDPDAQAEPVQEGELHDALARMLPIFEKLLQKHVFTTDKAGQVNADMEMLARAALSARKPLTEQGNVFDRAATLTPKPCDQCIGTMRGSTNGYSVFLRCELCGAVPMPGIGLEVKP